MRKKTLILLILWLAVGSYAQVLDQHATKKVERDSNVVEGTLGALETEGLLHAADINPAKTWTRQLASQKVGSRRSRHVYFVQFFLRDSEKVVQAIAVKYKSPIPEESGLVVYVVSQVLQTDGKPVPPRY